MTNFLAVMKELYCSLKARSEMPASDVSFFMITVMSDHFRLTFLEEQSSQNSTLS